MIQWMLAIWSLVPLPFLKPAWTTESSRFTYCWSLVWRILSITLLACETSALVRSFEHSLALPFFGIGIKTDLFQSCGHCWVFQICWHIECSTFTASSFRIWKSSTGIPSPPLALFVVMLSKAHLTLHSRMSGSRSGITPSWLSQILQLFATLLPKQNHSSQRRKSNQEPTIKNHITLLFYRLKIEFLLSHNHPYKVPILVEFCRLSFYS